VVTITHGTSLKFCNCIWQLGKNQLMALVL